MFSCLLQAHSSLLLICVEILKRGHSAVAAYLDGDVAGSRKALKRLLARNPNNVRVRLALNALEVAEPLRAADEIFLDINRVIMPDVSDRPPTPGS